MGSPTAACSGCNGPLLVSAGHAFIIAGRVQQVCQTCAQLPPDEWPSRRAVAPPAPRQPADDAEPRRRPKAATVVALGAACVALAPSSPGPAADQRPTVLFVEPSLDVESASRVAVAPTEQPRQHRLSLSLYGEKLVWYHPLAGERVLPESPSRRFGAERTGTRPECGAGHCGVDLGYERGPVIHAVAEGYVERIVRAADEKGGRYVKLRHPGGFCSFYMHLDRIHPELAVGDEISPGDPVGTMGRSGIHHSSPHLHFAVTLDQGENGPPRYVDPEPMLREAIVLEHEAPFPR